MKKISISIAIAVSLIVSINAYARDKTDYTRNSVLYNAVDWDKLCKNLKPVVRGECKIVHPASPIFKKDMFGKFSKMSCEREEEFFEKWKWDESNPLSPAMNCIMVMEATHGGRHVDYIQIIDGHKNESDYEIDYDTWTDTYFPDNRVD